MKHKYSTDNNHCHQLLKGVRYLKPQLHLENPSANIIGTSLLVLISCLQRNGTAINEKYPLLENLAEQIIY